MAALPSQLFLETIADHKQQPAALRLRFSLTDDSALEGLLASPEFAALTGRIPCLISKVDADALPETVRSALTQAACSVIETNALLQVDEWPSMLPNQTIYASGTWYLRPPAKPTSTQTASRALALKLLQLVAADAETRELEAIFRHDPSMSYQLLRLVNSVGMGNRRITSFSQAIVMLGRNQLRRWINLMLFAPRKEDPRLPMLMARVSVRARLMELLARAVGYDKATQDAAFMAGMFSLLGVLFGLPLAEVIKPLNIGDELGAAVLHQEGPIGALVAMATSAEVGDLTLLAAQRAAISAPPFDFDALQIEAYAWMLELIGEGSAGPKAADESGGAHG